MAEWYTKDEKTRKSCKMCNMLLDASAFQQGLTVFVSEANDCDNCEVAKAFPIPENEIVLFIYSSLPVNYDGMSGMRKITAEDIYVTMKMLEIPEELWCDYFNRVVYYHGRASEAIARRLESESKK